MKINKTTDYFNMAVEEAGKIRNGYETIEEAKVLDAGLEHYFFEELEHMEKEYNSELFQSYLVSHKYETIVFQFVADNSNHNKYCIVLN